MTLRGFIGSLLLFVGIVIMAGSAGDCDGACMDQANTVGEMLPLVLYGLIFVLGGVTLLWKR